MNDITKAKYYLNSRGSDMRHLTSFGLMLATARAKYNDVKLRLKTNKSVPDQQEIDAILDFAVLKYLSQFNQLPKNISDAFSPDTTLENKRDLALQWINAKG